MFGFGLSFKNQDWIWIVKYDIPLISGPRENLNGLLFLESVLAVEVIFFSLVETPNLIASSTWMSPSGRVNSIPSLLCGLYKVFSDKIKIFNGYAMINVKEFHFSRFFDCASLSNCYVGRSYDVHGNPQIVIHAISSSPLNFGPKFFAVLTHFETAWDGIASWQCTVTVLPLVELGGYLGRWAKRVPKKTKTYNCVVQKLTNVHEVKVN